MVVKTVKKYGNSGGVYLPRGWIGGKVRVELAEEPPDPVKDILSKVPLEHVISVILYGSYVRKELSEGSDIDVLLVVDDDAKMSIPEELRHKYDIQIKTTKGVKKAVTHDPIFYKIIADESLAIINHQFLDSLKKERRPGSIAKRIELIESSLSIVKGMYEECPSDMAYPLLMRLKEILILECFLSERKYSARLLKQELRHRITGKEISMLMNAYRLSDKAAVKYLLSKGTVIKLISLLEEKIEYVKQKARKKGNRILGKTGRDPQRQTEEG